MNQLMAYETEAHAGELKSLSTSAEPEISQTVRESGAPAREGIAEPTGPVIDQLSAHQFPNNLSDLAEQDEDDERGAGFPARGAEDDPLDREPELRRYRARTVGMLRRYLQYSLDTGRVPSLLGAEYFRSGVTSYGVASFEDRVIFVHDMESCLGKLCELSRQIIARHILQEHTCRETARLLHWSRRTILRTVPIALDELSEILLAKGLLEVMSVVEEKSCQEGEIDETLASDCKIDK